MDNSNVRIVRLKNGQDILCNLLINEDKILVNLLDPMLMETQTYGKSQHLMITDWLPSSLIKDNSTVIPITEVLCVMHPNDELVEYYNKMLKENDNSLVVKDMDDLDEEEMSNMMEVMEELKNTKGLVIH
jgi:hypothetical protein